MIFKVLVLAAISLNLAVGVQAREHQGLIAKGNYKEGLIVKGDFKNLPVFLVVQKNDQLTDEDLFKAIKVKLLAKNIRTSRSVSSSPHRLLVFFRRTDQNDIFFLELFLLKNTNIYAEGKSFIGPMFRPSQGKYTALGTSKTKSSTIDSLNKMLDQFLLNYLVSNIEYRLTSLESNPQPSKVLQDVKEYLEMQKKSEKVEKKLSK